LAALKDIIRVSRRAKTVYVNMIGLLLVVIILALAINIRVVTHIDNKIKVLDIISISENEEIDIIVRY
jgi:hypothetical protein